jgi:hypothetical protein
MMKRVFTLIALSALLSLSVYGQATVTQENLIVPIDFLITACNGETVLFTGESHVLQHSTGNGNASAFTVHINFHLEGTSASGTHYIVNEHVNGHETVAGASMLTSEARLVAVAQGSEDNLIVHTFIHTTTNANGEVTSTTFEFESDCQG